ncbi:MAG: MFS transporter [Alphaproteobacteria bacterium]|nr:MFS transporter [Alphaproteobacteria bacterium]
MPLALRLSLFYAGFFLSGGILLPFWPVWLSSRGLSAAEIGVVLAIGQWAKVAATPITGGVADHSGDPRRVMLVLAVVAVAGYALCYPAHGIAALAILNALTAASLAALLPVGDSLAITATQQGHVDFGRVRVWGTIAFIVATLLGGRILSGRAADVVLDLVIALTALNVGSCLLLPRSATHLGAGVARGSCWRLMLTRRHLVFLAATTLIAASHSVYYAFGSLRWQAQGFSDTTIAWLWAEGAAAEAVFLFWGATAVARCGPARLMALGAASGVVRWTVLGLTDDWRLLVLAQLLHAGTIAAAGLGGIHYLGRSIPPAQAATGQAITAAVVGGIGYGVFMPLAGALYGAYGGLAYLAMAAVSAAATVAAVALDRLMAVAPTNS